MLSIRPKHLGYNYFMVKGGYIYIITNKTNTVLYIGVTSNLTKRIW